QSASARSSRSIATTSSAPRRSISKAQNPSNVPTSRQRFPASDRGIGSSSTTGRVSNQPGVTTPGASSSVWYHSLAPIAASSASLEPSEMATSEPYQRAWEAPDG